jgi:hypothetical protein
MPIGSSRPEGVRQSGPRRLALNGSVPGEAFSTTPGPSRALSRGPACWSAEIAEPLAPLVEGIEPRLEIAPLILMRRVPARRDPSLHLRQAVLLERGPRGIRGVECSNPRNRRASAGGVRSELAVPARASAHAASSRFRAASDQRPRDQSGRRRTVVHHQLVRTRGPTRNGSRNTTPATEVQGRDTGLGARRWLDGRQRCQRRRLRPDGRDLRLGR